MCRTERADAAVRAATQQAEIVQEAKNLGNQFGAAIATSVAGRETNASADELEVFEAVVNKICDDACDELEDTLAACAPDCDTDRAAELAIDFLVAWSDNAAGIPTAILDDDAGRVLELEYLRDQLAGQLAANVLALNSDVPID